MGVGRVRKKPFYAIETKRSFPLRASWKITWCRRSCSSSKPRSGSKKSPHTLRGKTGKKFCSMKDDGTCKNSWSWLSSEYPFSFLTLFCKDRFSWHALLMCHKTVPKVKHHAIAVTPTTSEFVSLSPESSVRF